ncbi:hypothetical protein JHK86_009750 [Glycine max]|nr:hypothetical protein JHK86_009750 [Glycine max]
MAHYDITHLHPPSDIVGLWCYPSFLVRMSAQDFSPTTNNMGATSLRKKPSDDSNDDDSSSTTRTSFRDRVMGNKQCPPPLPSKDLFKDNWLI